MKRDLSGSRRTAAVFLFFLLFFKPFAISGLSGDEVSPSGLRLREATLRLEAFDQPLSLRERRILRETPSQAVPGLSPSLRELFGRRDRLREEKEFWELAAGLESDILRLEAKEDRGRGLLRRREAGLIAEAAILAFREISGRYRMIRPAGLHNIFVNAGLKKEGFCWHWTRDLRKRLSGLDLREFDLRWATAREGTLREHNTLVIVPAGGALEDGLLLDGWRHSGKPFWTRVKGDKYPWRPGEYLAGEALQ